MYLLSTYYLPGAIVSTGNKAVKKKDKASSFMELKINKG